VVDKNIRTDNNNKTTIYSTTYISYSHIGIDNQKSILLMAIRNQLKYITTYSVKFIEPQNCNLLIKKDKNRSVG